MIDKPKKGANNNYAVLTEHVMSELASEQSQGAIKQSPNNAVTKSTIQTAPGRLMEISAYQRKISELEKRLEQNSKVPLRLTDLMPNPWQPRKRFSAETIAELAETIRVSGLLNPVLVRRNPNPKDGEPLYQIVAGERRWRAHQYLDMEFVDCYIVDITDQQMATLALIENLARDELAPYEVYLGIVAVEKTMGFPSKEALAAHLGISRRHLYRYYAFAQLPAGIIQSLEEDPTLLPIAAVDEVRTLINEKGTLAANALEELWPDVVSGLISGSQLPTGISEQLSRKAKGIPPSPTASGLVARQIDKIYTGKTQSGSITRDTKSFVVKIKAGMLSASKEAQLRAFVSELLKENDTD